MTKKAAKKPDQTAPDTIDELFVIGLDKAGKPQGARFRRCDDRVVHAAFGMSLQSISLASPTFAEIGMKLPQGRLYASGKIFVPNIRRDLFDKLKAVLATPEDGSHIFPSVDPVSDPAGGDATPSANPPVPCVSPMIAGLPRSWESVGVGHMVLVHASAEDGWWECVVTAREDDVLTLKYRDYPKQPIMVRHISTVALVNPGPQ